MLLSYHENNVVESITGITTARTSPGQTSITENTVLRIFLNNNNQAALTNLNKRPYESANRYVGTKYA